MTDSSLNSSYDAIVIGAGAGGGIVACVLAEAGQRVLLLERGKRMTWADDSRDHLRNHRFSKYGHNTGPDLVGHPRVVQETDGSTRVVAPNDGGYQNNAMVEGGGTLIYGAQAWRFMPQDFRMATTYGVPRGSSMADWPISYDDLAPYYQRAEWEIGVSGDSAVAANIWKREKAFPMPPLPETLTRPLLKSAADKLGWQTMAVPLLINSQNYGGRLPCVACGSCVGFTCPSDGKNGSQNTVIPRAMATGLCDRLVETQAERIDTDSAGKVIGVTFVSVRDGKTERRSVRAKRVIISAGAIETARLLLNSSSTHHPAGLGNEHDYVGRNLQGHVYVGAQGYMEKSVYTGRGPGVSICTVQFNHGNAGVIGGGLLADEFIKLPIIFWNQSQLPGMRRWGATAKKFMRENFTRNVHIQGPIQDTPNPECRVTIDPAVKDRFGIPVIRQSGQIHPASLDSAEFMRQKAMRWLEAAGAQNIWSWRPQMGVSGGQHQAGTARMGDDVKTSVTDKWGRVHGHDNLFVADGSLHVTNGGFNPVLTIMALAYRVADGIVKAR